MRSHSVTWGARYRAASVAAAAGAPDAFETPHLQPIVEPNPPVQRRASVEPALARIGAVVQPFAPLGVYLPGDLDGTFLATWCSISGHLRP